MTHEPYILDRRSGGTESCGSLYKVGSLYGHDITKHLLLGIGEKACLDYHLKDRALRMDRIRDDADLECCLLEPSGLYEVHVDDHIF